MTLSEEEATNIKEHLLKQVTNFPEEKQEEVKRQIEAMTPEDVENFVKQNQLTHLGDQCIICAIASRQVKSFEIAEDDANLAVLEINPLSKGHTIIFPKTHTDQISAKTQKLAELVGQKIMQNFSPKEIKTRETKIMEHPVLEVIPLYGGEAERKQASPEELAAVKEGLSQTPAPKPKEEPKPTLSEKPKEIPKLKPRIP